MLKGYCKLVLNTSYCSNLAIRSGEYQNMTLMAALNLFQYLLSLQMAWGWPMTSCCHLNRYYELSTNQCNCFKHTDLFEQSIVLSSAHHAWRLQCCETQHQFEQADWFELWTTLLTGKYASKLCSLGTGRQQRGSQSIRQTRKKLIWLSWLIVLMHLIKYIKCKLGYNDLA